MGIALIKLKIMPSSPDVDIEKISNEAKSLAEKNEAQNLNIKTEPIAFGLNALILSFGWNEDKELETFENQLKEIENVSSTEIIDMRRAFG